MLQTHADSPLGIVVCGYGICGIGIRDGSPAGAVSAGSWAKRGGALYDLHAVGVPGAHLAAGRGAVRASGAVHAELAVVLRVVIRCERAAGIDV